MFLIFIFNFFFLIHNQILFSQDSRKQTLNNKEDIFLETKEPQNLIPEVQDISLFYYFQGIFIFFFFLLLFYFFIKYIEYKKNKNVQEVTYPFKKLYLDSNKSLYFLKILDHVYLFAITDKSMSFIDKIPYSEELENFLKEIDIYSFSEEEVDKKYFSFKKVFAYYKHFLNRK